MPNLSGSGGRSSGVNYATSSLFDRMYWSLQASANKADMARRQSALLAFSNSYQACTQGSAGSLKRYYRGQLYH